MRHSGGLSALVIAFTLVGATVAYAGDVDDTVFMKDGGRMRGIVVEESPTSGVRLKQPDGKIVSVAVKDLDHVQYGAKPKPAATASSSSASPPAGSVVAPAALSVPTNGVLRLRATCGDTPQILANAQKLVVVDVQDARDMTLSPTSDANPALRYDETTKQRVMKDPEFVDYELPAGKHRIRAKAHHCLQTEQVFDVEAGKTTEAAFKLEVEVIPLVDVNVTRPSTTNAADAFELRGADGQPACRELPCNAKIPAKENGYRVVWKHDGAQTLLVMPDPGDRKSAQTQYTTSKARPIAAFAPIGVGAILTIVGIANLTTSNAYQCTYNGLSGTHAVNMTEPGHCGAPPYSKYEGGKGESLSGGGAAMVGVGVAGLLMIGGGVLWLAMGWGGSESMSVQYSSEGPKPAAPQKPNIGLTSSGIGGSF